jgi:hypothetical protein
MSDPRLNKIDGMMSLPRLHIHEGHVKGLTPSLQSRRENTSLKEKMTR